MVLYDIRSNYLNYCIEISLARMLQYIMSKARGNEKMEEGLEADRWDIIHCRQDSSFAFPSKFSLLSTLLSPLLSFLTHGGDKKRWEFSKRGKVHFALWKFFVPLS